MTMANIPRIAEEKKSSLPSIEDYLLKTFKLYPPKTQKKNEERIPFVHLDNIILYLHIIS